MDTGNIVDYFGADNYIENRKHFFACERNLNKTAWINVQDPATQPIRASNQIVVFQRHRKIALKTLTRRSQKKQVLLWIDLYHKFCATTKWTTRILQILLKRESFVIEWPHNRVSVWVVFNSFIYIRIFLSSTKKRFTLVSCNTSTTLKASCSSITDVRVAVAHRCHLLNMTKDLISWLKRVRTFC